jgi:hypothetical protein
VESGGVGGSSCPLALMGYPEGTKCLNGRSDSLVSVTAVTKRGAIIAVGGNVRPIPPVLSIVQSSSKGASDGSAR